jgi:hypothetical protein
MFTFDEINHSSGFANGEKFTDEQEVRDYFTPESMRQMFGANWTAERLNEMTEAVIKNKWWFA